MESATIRKHCREKKNPNVYKAFSDILIVSTEHGLLFRAGLSSLLKIKTCKPVKSRNPFRKYI